MLGRRFWVMAGHMRSEKLVKDDTKVQRFDVKCSLR
tara:strand:+ start:198 stop:305 length:108 start_codon:yes stop_codon:yes gene_type:complete